MLNWWVKPPRIQILTISWALIILVLSAIPGRDMPKVDLVNADKLAHAFVYGVLFLMLAFWANSIQISRKVIFSSFLAIVYGIIMELMQDMCFSERFFDWYDVLANTTGVLLGIVIFRYIR